ncbi:unnamed protein product [Spirodela intermedia]|uniref:Uncharacterized protein n=1 Tax=Spirodela intermedia TaxID=51605 RepID=A0A7I8JZL6_SPIIN|nr:unnamed protein product [Spirodela intermedia]
MAAAAASRIALHLLPRLRLRSSFHTETPVQLAIRTAIESNDHRRIPLILSAGGGGGGSSPPDEDPFSFLAHLPPPLTTRIVDDILQSLMSFCRPRSLSHPSFAALLSVLLPQPHPHLPAVNFPLALAVLQTAIRCGFSPPPSTRHSLSLFWVHLRHPHHGRKPPAVRLLLSMRGVGYRPDLLTLNFLVFSLCSSSEVEEAVGVLRGMAGAGCGPDCDSYCAVIDACCGSAVGDVPRAVALLREMVAGEGMVPRKGTVGKVVGALRREGQGRKAAKVVAFLDSEGVAVGFEEYEAVVEGCLECKEFVTAGKMVVKMSEVGFIPYIRVRHRVVEGLAGIGQQELAGTVRQSLAKIRS